MEMIWRRWLSATQFVGAVCFQRLPCSTAWAARPTNTSDPNVTLDPQKSPSTFDTGHSKKRVSRIAANIALSCPAPLSIFSVYPTSFCKFFNPFFLASSISFTQRRRSNCRDLSARRCNPPSCGNFYSLIFAHRK